MARRKLLKCPSCGVEVDHLVLRCYGTIEYIFDGNRYTLDRVDAHDEEYVCPECCSEITSREDVAKFLLRHFELVEMYGWRDEVFDLCNLPEKVLSALKTCSIRRLATVLRQYSQNEVEEMLALLTKVLTSEEVNLLRNYLQTTE